MKRTTVIGALGVMALLSAAAIGQAVHPEKVKFNGIGLDSTYAQVVKALGKPTKDGKATSEECIGGREKMVEFAGASFYFMDGDSKNRRTFEVKSFEVTSAKFIVSGVKVGDTEAAVRRRFGRKFTASVDEDSGEKVWSYELDAPGFTTVYFKNGKVVKIASAFQVC